MKVRWKNKRKDIMKLNIEIIKKTKNNKSKDNCICIYDKNARRGYIKEIQHAVFLAFHKKE